MASSSPNNYETWQKLCNKSIQNQHKASSAKQHLQFLNEIANGPCIQTVFQELNGKHIYKLKPGLVFRRVSRSMMNATQESYYQYGHIKIDKQPIRISTCLSFKRQIVQFPIYEQDFFKFGQFTLFTCGDLYLLVVNSLLENMIGSRRTDKGNFEINISSLFEYGAVYKFGLIDFLNQTYTNEFGINKITVILPPRYLLANLKGCITGTTPHFILARLENSGSINTFDYELWTNYRDIYFAFKKRNNIKQWNAYRIQSEKNTNKVLNREKWEFTNLIGKAPGIITYNENVHFMIFNWQKVNDLEKIRQYCHKVYTKYFRDK
jgi:hypothetical protein